MARYTLSPSFAVTQSDATPKPRIKALGGSEVLLLPRVTLLQNLSRVDRDKQGGFAVTQSDATPKPFRKVGRSLQVLLLPRVTLLQNLVELATAGLEFCCYPE